MVVIALCLVAVAVLVAITAITNGGAPATLDLEFFKVHTTVAGVFLSGVGSLLVFVLAWSMLRMGLRHSRRRRAEVKRLRSAAAENARRSPDPRPEPDREVDHQVD
jgi:hypothetical protein